VVHFVQVLSHYLSQNTHKEMERFSALTAVSQFYIPRSYCHVSQCLRRGFRFVIGFIGYLQVITTINYYIIAALHNVQSLHTNIFRLSALVFTGLIESHIPNIAHK
jgi:hypothetical protein